MRATTLRWMLGVALLAALGAGVPAARAGEPVVIAGEDDWAPYSAAESPGQPHARPPRGFSVDLIRAAFATQGITPQFITVPFSRCMMLARTREVAGCFNATITDENRPHYHWHDPPMFEEELSIFGRAGEPGPELRASDLRGKRVALTNGYTYPTALLRDTRIEKFTATSDAALLRMLLNGRVDYILLNRMPGLLRINASPEFRGQVVRRGIVSADAFWVAFSREHPQGQALAAAFGRGLAQLRRDGRYAQMQEAFRARIGGR